MVTTAPSSLKFKDKATISGLGLHFFVSKSSVLVQMYTLDFFGQSFCPLSIDLLVTFFCASSCSWGLLYYLGKKSSYDWRKSWFMAKKKLIKDILEIDLVFAMSLLGINCKLHSLGHLYIQIFKKEEINWVLCFH